MILEIILRIMKFSINIILSNKTFAIELVFDILFNFQIYNNIKNYKNQNI